MMDRGVVGEVHTITFLGQHPLLYGSRPMWYFEPGKHGGTLNDIAIHGIDIVPVLTGRRFVEVTAARGWNAGFSRHPEFQTGAVAMLRLDNDAAVMTDVSYLASDKTGYSADPYWRFTISGSEGVIETSAHATTVKVWRHDSDVVEEPVGPPREGGFLEDYLADLAGTPNEAGLHTARVLESSRVTLLAQRAADTGDFPLAIPPR